MNQIGAPERATQDRVIKLFTDELSYQYLGDWTDRTSNSNIEEEGMRKAAANINQLISKYEKNYAVSDKQDVLAMCALQFASLIEIKAINKEEDLNEASDVVDTADFKIGPSGRKVRAHKIVFNSDVKIVNVFYVICILNHESLHFSIPYAANHALVRSQ